MKSWWIKPWYHLVNQRSIFAFSCNHYEASTLSTHFPEVFGILEGSFLSLSLSFFFMISNLQKSCRNSTGYSYYTPYLNSPIIYIFLHLFYYSMNWFICVYHILCSVAQSRPTLCDPMDCTWPGSSVHEDSPDKNTGVGCHTLLYRIYMYILFVFWNTASKLDIVPNYSLNQHVFTENKVLFSYAIEWLSKLGSLTHTITI